MFKTNISIKVTDAAKAFGQQWVYIGQSHTLQQGQTYAITGPNGSGKSTFLRMLAGLEQPTKGKVEFFNHHKAIDPNHWYQHLSYCAPGMALNTELTLNELLSFHLQLRQQLYQITKTDFVNALNLQKAANKPLSTYSSGMLQKVKLGLSLLSNAPVLLLDEPVTNFDDTNIAWYRQWIQKALEEKLVVVASNNFIEYDFCAHTIPIN